LSRVRHKERLSDDSVFVHRFSQKRTKQTTWNLMVEMMEEFIKELT
jgi:hypothetical protein